MDFLLTYDIYTLRTCENPETFLLKESVLMCLKRHIRLILLDYGGLERHVVVK